MREENSQFDLPASFGRVMEDVVSRITEGETSPRMCGLLPAHMIPEGWFCSGRSWNRARDAHTYTVHRNDTRHFTITLYLFRRGGYVSLHHQEERDGASFATRADARRVIFEWLARPGNPGYGIELR